MTSEQGEIPLTLDGDFSSRFDLPGPGAGGAVTSLESERLGLLAAPPKVLDKDRRMEDWIASNLDLDQRAPSAPRSAWIRLIDGLPGMKRVPQARRSQRGVETSMVGWSRFHVAYKRGVTVVRLCDKNLTRETHVRELACDLLDLIEAGNHRVVLSFQNVERLASWVIVAVEEARRLCESADGGALKICGLPQDLATVFPIAGVNVKSALHANEAEAIDSPWPEASHPRALPIEILSAIIRGGDIPPIRGGAPSEAAEPTRPVVVAPPKSAANSAGSNPLDGLWLLVQIGSSKGRSVAVSGSRFVIGRDRSCQLRLGSPIVSKFHSAIERREGGGIVLQDLGSTNGTMINGQLLRSKETPLNEGDRVQIGPIVLTVTVGAPRTETGKVDQMVAGWLNRDGSSGRPFSDDAPATESFLTNDGGAADPESRVRHEVIQDVLVVTPLLPELDDDEGIELLRSQLHALFNQPTPRHVVVNLECVRHISAQAIGVLLAHHLRLDRTGGALRICQAHARLMAVLHHVRLTILVECHPTMDEAVLAAWPRTIDHAKDYA